MAYVSFGQASQPGRSVARPWRGRLPLPWETDQPTPAYQKKLLLLRKRRAGVTRQAQRARAMQLEGLGKFKLKKIFKPIAKILKPITKLVKPFLAPLVAMIPVVGIPAAAAIKAVQTIRASVKAKAAQAVVVADVQQAPSWGTMTTAQQQAVIAAIMAGQVPNVQVPPDVSAAYQQSIQRQAAALPPPPEGPPAMPMPEPAAAPAPTEAGIMGLGGTGTLIALGAAGLVVTMAMGGGGRRR